MALPDKTNPKHYTRYKKQPIEEFFEVFQDGPALCNVSKYLMRHDEKDGEEDIKKAKRYVQFCFNWYDYTDLLDEKKFSKAADRCVSEMLEKGLVRISEVKPFVRKYKYGDRSK
jgi:hypothetical protein